MDNSISSNNSNETNSNNEIQSNSGNVSKKDKFQNKNNMRVINTSQSFQIVNKEDLLMAQLTNFFKDPQNIQLMLPIIDGNSGISLRVLDWFITNYSKSNQVQYKLDNENEFRVHKDYKSQLKAYSKKQFDPFCRRERILFYYNCPITNESKYIITTVGQLNFFRWAIVNRIIQYINNNLQSIESDMLVSAKKSSQEKRKENNKLKKKINKHEINITVTFN